MSEEIIQNVSQRRKWAKRKRVRYIFINTHIHMLHKMRKCDTSFISFRRAEGKNNGKGVDKI